MVCHSDCKFLFLRYEFWNFLDQDPDYTRPYESKFGAPDLILECLTAGGYESLYDKLMFKRNDTTDLVILLLSVGNFMRPTS